MDIERCDIPRSAKVPRNSSRSTIMSRSIASSWGVSPGICSRPRSRVGTAARAADGHRPGRDLVPGNEDRAPGCIGLLRRKRDTWWEETRTGRVDSYLDSVVDGRLDRRLPDPDALAGGP